MIDQSKNNLWLATASMLHKINTDIKDLETRRSYLMEQLKTLSGEETSFGGKFIFLKVNRSGTINYDSIPELKGIDLNMYRKSDVSYWQLKSQE